MNELEARNYAENIVFGLVIYAIPTLVAICRRLKNWKQIALINTLLGWTIFGWIYCFIRSCSRRAESLPYL